jgi:putative sterol carrier protein
MAKDSTSAEAALAAIDDADASQLAAMVAQIPDDELAEGMSDPDGRNRVLDQIFKRMADHVEPAQIEGVDAVVHFRITGGPADSDDVYEVVIKDGRVHVNSHPMVGKPRVTITVRPVPFLKLVTGQKSGPVMFMTGKLKLDGDVMFASRLTSFFRIPTAS